MTMTVEARDAGLVLTRRCGGRDHQTPAAAARQPPFTGLRTAERSVTTEQGGSYEPVAIL